MSPVAKKRQTDESSGNDHDDDTAAGALVCDGSAACIEDPVVVGRPELFEGDFTFSDAENMAACADWAYIYHFECAFEAMDSLSAAFQDGRIPLGCGVAARLDRWIHKAYKRVPAAQRRAMGARVVDGLDAQFELLYEASLAVYEARAGCCDPQDPLPIGQTAALAWTVERFQHELSLRGAGATAFFALRVGKELMQAFRILCSPDLARFIGGGFEAGLADSIERLVGSRMPDGRPRMPIFQRAELAVAIRKAIDQVAALDAEDPLTLTMVEVDGLMARLALLRAASGQRDHRNKREQFDDDGTAASNVIRLTHAVGGTPF